MIKGSKKSPNGIGQPDFAVPVVQRVPQKAPFLASQLLTQLPITRQSSTPDISGNPRGNPTCIISLILIEMRIVNYSINTSPCAPAESNLAACTPHLIAPRNFVNGNTTRWTWLCIFLKHGDSFNIVFITYVIPKGSCGLDPLWNVTFYRVTFRTNI